MPGASPAGPGTLLNDLVEGIARATTQGALRLAPGADDSEVSPAPGMAAPAGANIRLRLPGEEAWIPEDPVGDGCPENASLDLAEWGPGDRAPHEAIATFRAALAEDIDALDEERALGLARLYVSLGFGAEARAVLAAVAPAHSATPLLRAMSLIVDGEPDPSGVLAALSDCAGRAQLWAALARGEPGEPEATLVAVSELPLALRRHLGPRLIESLLRAGDATTAEAIRAAIDRAAGPHGVPFALASAQIDVGRETASGLTAIEDLATDPSPASDDALALLLEVAHDQGAAVDPETVALANARADDLRGTPIGGRLYAGAVRALLRLDAFDEAALRLSDDGMPAGTAEPLVREFMAALAERGSDDAVLVHAAAGRLDFASTVRGGAEGAAVASRLLDMGMPHLAWDFLPELASTRDEIALEARMRIAEGNPAAALDLLRRVRPPGEDHLRLQVDALSALGRREEADAIRRRIGAANVQTETGRPAEAPDLSGSSAPGSSPRALVAASEDTRQRIDAFLAAHPGP